MSLTTNILVNPQSSFDPLYVNPWDPCDSARIATALELASLKPGTIGTSTVAGSINWKETCEGHVFTADIPGLKKEDVKVEIVHGRILQIYGERKTEKEEKNDKWYFAERSDGKFVMRFRLPENAKVDLVMAKMENGALTVTVPRWEEKKAEVKCIQIFG